jgi:hypothetical protein
VIKFSSFLILVLHLALAGCATAPRDVALATSMSSFGLVYTGTLMRVEPVYLRSDYPASTRFDASASSTAVLLAHMGNKDSESPLAKAASDIAAAVSGETEGRYRNKFCQYYIAVEDPELIEAMKSTSTSSTDSEEYKLERYRELQRIREQLAYIQPDPESQDYDYVKGQIRELNGQLKDLYLKLEDANKAPPSRTISVVNPCRSFSIGADIEISKYQDQIVLEQAIATDSTANRNNQWDGMIDAYEKDDEG